MQPKINQELYDAAIVAGKRHAGDHEVDTGEQYDPCKAHTAAFTWLYYEAREIERDYVGRIQALKRRIDSLTRDHDILKERCDRLEACFDDSTGPDPDEALFLSPDDEPTDEELINQEKCMDALFSPVDSLGFPKGWDAIEADLDAHEALDELNHIAADLAQPNSMLVRGFRD